MKEVNSLNIKEIKELYELVIDQYSKVSARSYFHKNPEIQKSIREYFLSEEYKKSNKALLNFLEIF